MKTIVSMPRYVHKIARGVSLLLLASICVARSVAALDAPTTDRLDGLLMANRTIDLVRALHEGTSSPIQQLEWLRRRATEGHVVAQYELANQLQNKDASSALSWYAKARLGRILDVADCKDRSASSGVAVLLDLVYQSLQLLADKNEGLYAAEIEKALMEDDSAQRRAPPYWICAHGIENADESTLLPVNERRKGRQSAKAFLVTRGQARIIEARLNANLNPDGFEIRGLGEFPSAKDDIGALAWVDNDVVVLNGFPKDSTEPLGVLYSWNVVTNKLTKIAVNTLACIFGDRIRYEVVRDGRRYVREGTLGDEVETPLLPQKNSDVVRYQCRIIPKAELPYQWPKKQLEAGGVLEYPRIPAERSRVPVKFHPEGTKEVVVLPFFRSEMLSDDAIQFSRYLKAYWVTEHMSSVSVEKSGRLWTISLDGRSETITTPPGPWVSYGTFYFPVVGGWVIQHRSNGVYLWRNSNVTKVLAGPAVDAAVSPNGCRIATKIGVPGNLSNVGYHFKMIDVCKAGAK